MTLGPDTAAMSLDEMLRDGETQAGPAARAGWVGLIETLENSLQVVRWDPDPGVADPKPETIRLGFRGDLNPPAGGRELDGVGKKVQQHLPDRPLVGYDAWEVGDGVDQGYSLHLGGCFDALQAGCYHAGQIQLIARALEEPVSDQCYYEEGF